MKALTLFFHLLIHLLFLIISGPLRTIICGGIGGVSLWVAIFPFDVVKSRVQIQSANSPKNPPFVKMLTIIARDEGKPHVSNHHCIQ